MSSQTPNINLTLPTGAEKVSRQIINDNNTKIDTAIGTLNSNMNPYGTKYIRGKIDVSSGSPQTVLEKMQAFISGITTDNKEVDFDVMLSYQGVHYFIGHIYPNKDWGHGFYIGVDGKAFKWTRLNNVDSVEELALNSNMTKRFLKTSTGDNRNGVLHAWMNDGIRSAMAIGEMACMVGIFQGNTYYGIIVKVTDNIMMGHMFTVNYGGGFYFRDNSTDSVATSTDFTF